jgi:hypothetical protein
MAEIIHSTQLDEDGPWLLGRERLLELDSLLDAEWTKLEKYRECLITEEINDEIARTGKTRAERFDEAKERQNIQDRLEKDYFYRKGQNLVILLSGHRRVVARSFEEAMRDPALLGEKPEGFSLGLKCCKIECRLEVPYYNTSLRLKVDEDRDPVAKELFASLKSWIDTARPPYWQQLWLRLKGYGAQWNLCLMIFLAASLYFIAIAPDTSATARSARHAQAVELLKNGISQTNQFKALELILSYESGDPPSSRTVMIPSWFWWFLCGAPLFCVALSFTPKVVLGIGKGQESIKKWLNWMKFIAITLPLWIIGTFIWPKALAVLQNLF